MWDVEVLVVRKADLFGLIVPAISEATTQPSVDAAPHTQATLPSHCITTTRGDSSRAHRNQAIFYRLIGNPTLPLLR